MQNYERKNHTRPANDSILIIRIFVSFFFIVVSIIAITVVVRRVMSIKILEKISLKPEVHDSLSITTDTNSGISLFITDEKGLKFRKEDKTFAREEWIEKNGELFYFDTAGYGLNGDLKIDGQVYTFENGKLKNIKRDTAYVARADSNLFSSVKSSEYLVWLEDSEKERNFFPIKYSLINGDETDYLGTEADKQYASPNMLKIYTGYIYYLAVGGGDGVSGRLYRMRPGAIHKESVGVGVTGFVILSEDVIYYCDGEKVMKAHNWNSTALKLPDYEELTEDGEIITKVATPSDGIIINERGETINLTDLPAPDIIEETMVVETEESSAERVDDNASIRNSAPINETPVIPIIGGVREEVTDNSKTPQVHEVEAPQ